MLIIMRIYCIDTASGIVTRSHWPTGAQVENARNLCTGRPPDDTRCCINTIQPTDDEHITLVTCRGLEQTYCKIKQVCIKLVIV